ncbi:MAG: hypothetical protein KBE09_03700 [Candidatus Pacebacteria bacterium]|nr:hypothetical protein [Candidatus Paceibacterota bacterium]
MSDPTSAALSRAFHQISDYEHTTIAEYEHWYLRIHLDQAYLGRSILWRKRKGNAVSPTMLSQKERDEYFRVARNWETGIKRLWNPTRFNHAWLCNMTHEHGGHGHWHLIPRYAEVRRWHGQIFTDDNPLGNYAPYNARVVDRTLLDQLRDDIRGAMR